MKVILICKDCGDQFSSPHPEGKSAQWRDLAAQNSELNVYLTSCMGVCPEQKISVMELEDNKTNTFKTKSLLPSEIDALI